MRGAKRLERRERAPNEKKKEYEARLLIGYYNEHHALHSLLSILLFVSKKI